MTINEGSTTYKKVFADGLSCLLLVVTSFFKLNLMMYLYLERTKNYCKQNYGLSLFKYPFSFIVRKSVGLLDDAISEARELVCWLR